MNFTPLADLDGIEIDDDLVEIDEDEYRAIKIVGEPEVMTADVTKIPCDTVELASFLYAVGKFDRSMLPDVDDLSIDAGELQQTFVVNDADVFIEEDLEDIELPENDGEPMILIEADPEDCTAQSDLSFVISHIYSYHLEDILILPADFVVPPLDLQDSSEANQALRRKRLMSVYEQALAAGGTCVSDGPLYDGRQAFGIACPHCQFFHWENSGDICAAHISQFPDLRDTDPNLEELAELLESAAKSLDANQPNFELSVEVLTNVAESLGIEDSEALADLELD